MNTELDKTLKQLECRIKVLEKALKNRAFYCVREYLCKFVEETVIQNEAQYRYDLWIKLAEEELAEERKDDNK